MLKKWIVAGVILLLVVTGIVATVHLSAQEDISCMVIRQEEWQLAVSFEELDAYAFSGELTDGKGDTTVHEYTGILLRELLEKKGIDIAGIQTVTVTSADQYSAVFTAEEILQEDRVYVAVTADGAKIEGIEQGSAGVQVIVFHDTNSRRCVRHAQIITLE